MMSEKDFLRNPMMEIGGELDQRRIFELPEVVRVILSQIREDIESGRTIGKALFGSGEYPYFGDDINLIPSRIKGDCHPILVAICYDGDRLDARLKECLECAAVTCAGINREVYFFTTKWESHAIGARVQHIEALRKNGVRISFIYMSAKGEALMPV